MRRSYTYLDDAFLCKAILIISNGLTLSGITVFDEVLLEEFKWSRSELKFRDFLNLVCAAIILPFIGALIDRYGVKRSILFGLGLLSICYYLYSGIGQLRDMYLLHIGFAFVVATSGVLAIIIMVSQRVKEKRGLAIGIAVAGTSLGGMIIPQIGTRLLEQNEWRTGFKYEALLPIFLLVVVLLLLRDRRNATKEEASATEDQEEPSFTFKEALRSPTYWGVGLAGFLSYYAILAIISNLFLYLRSLDFTPVAAGNALSLLFGIILGAKFLSGFLTDYFSQFKLFRIQFAIMTVGAVLLALGDASLIIPALVVIGLGWGGMYTLFNYIIIEAFGLKSAGKIGGTISTLESIGGGLGIWLTGLLYDQYGSYSQGFWVVAAFVATSFIISFFIRPTTKTTVTE